MCLEFPRIWNILVKDSSVPHNSVQRWSCSQLIHEENGNERGYVKCQGHWANKIQKWGFLKQTHMLSTTQTASQPATFVAQLQVSLGHICCILTWNFKFNTATSKWKRRFWHPNRKLGGRGKEVRRILSFGMSFFNLQVGLSTPPPCILPAQSSPHYTEIIWYFAFAHFAKLQKGGDHWI